MTRRVDWSGDALLAKMRQDAKAAGQQGAKPAARLTSTQRDMLAALAAEPARWWTGLDLTRHLYGYFANTQGTHQTAASLVRRGLVEKDSRRGVTYRITKAGQETG